MLQLLLAGVITQFADKPGCGQSNRGLVSSRTSQLAKMFDGKFGVCNHSKCDYTICFL